MIRLGICALAAFLTSTQSFAQSTAIVAGRVRLVGPRDTTLLPGSRVVLHRVGIATQGPIDSLARIPDGRFRFRFVVDTAASYLVSTRYGGIEYFSVPWSPGAATTTLDLLVFDTSSVAPTRTRMRTIVVSAPDPGGARTVVDWFTISNDGAVTRVGRDSLTPTWSAALPASVGGVGLGDARFSQISPDAVVFRNDSVVVTAPLSPGQKELLLQYEVPPGARRFEVSLAGIDSADVFAEERGVKVVGTGWSPADSQSFQGRVFHRFRRIDANARAITLDFPGAAIRPGTTLVLLIAALALAIVGVTAMRWRRRPAVRVMSDPAAALADRIAALDLARGKAAAEGKPLGAIEAERERLITELRAALAARRRGS